MVFRGVRNPTYYWNPPQIVTAPQPAPPTSVHTVPHLNFKSNPPPPPLSNLPPHRWRVNLKKKTKQILKPRKAHLFFRIK